MAYISLILREVGNRWLSRWSNWRGKLVAFLVQSAILFIVLYERPMFGSVGEVARLAMATASAVIGSAILTLLFDALGAPARIHNRVMACLREHHALLKQVFDAEAKARTLATLHADGRRLYRTVLDPDDYYKAMDNWVERVREVLKAQFPVADAYRFEHAQYSSMHYMLPNDVDEAWQTETYERRCEYSGRIDSLKELVEFSASYSVFDYALIERVIKSGDDIVRTH